MPGGRGILRKKCGMIAKIFAGNSSLSEGGCLQARAKWSFSICQTIVKMMGTERARRNEDVSIGITLIAVTVVEIRRVEVQEPISEIFSANRPLEEKN